MSYNLADLFESVVDTVGERTVIVSEQRRLNYLELDERANRLANYLLDRGIGHGDHIGLQLRNGSEYIEGMLAAYKIRAVPININFHYVEDELEYLYKDASLSALVVHESFSERAATVASRIEKLAQLLSVAESPGNPAAGNLVDYEQALAGSSGERNFPARDSDDLYIVYTGGTTGMPKGVMWHHQDIFFAAMGGGDPDQTKGPITAAEQLAERILDIPFVVLPAPPFMHAAAQWTAFNGLFAGGRIVIPARGQFDPEAIWQSINDEKVLMLIVVGDAMATPLADTLEASPGTWDTSSLMVVASGGALFSPATKKRLMTLSPGTMIMDGLGSSETGLMGSKFSADAENDDAQPHFMVNEHMTVLGKDNRPVVPGSGHSGMLARKGHIPIGYYNAPEKSAKTFVEVDGERWAIPGDLATVEEDGTILLLGRGSVSINTGGEKVFPEEVEASIKEHPDIFDTVVVGVSDERYGQQVVAVCQTRSGEPLQIKALRDFCRDKLAAYKLPRELVCMDNIKRSPAGKADYPWATDVATRELARRQEATGD